MTKKRPTHRPFWYVAALLLLAGLVRAQPWPEGRFLTDSIEIGRPFQYALTYRHPASVDVLFPDTVRQFRPFRVKDVAVTTTQTTGSGPAAISRDSAVYTLISFETDSIQWLRVPVQRINTSDCTTLWTPVDTVFLRSRLAGAQNLTMATATHLVPLQQELNYPVLGAFLVAAGVSLLLIYLVFGKSIRRQWRLYQLRQRHVRFLRKYDRYVKGFDAQGAADTTMQAIIVWKTYLEQLERQPYASLTTPEIAERTGDDRVADALREADRMMYGGAVTGQSPEALLILRDVADQTYHRRRDRLRTGGVETPPDAVSLTD